MTETPGQSDNLGGSESENNGNNENQSKKTFPTLIQKPGKSGLRVPPTRSRPTPGADGKIDLRAHALGLHQQMSAMYAQPKPQLQDGETGPKITRVAQEEVEGHAIMKALEALKAYFPLTGLFESHYHSACEDSRVYTPEAAGTIRQIVKDIQNSSKLEFTSDSTPEGAIPRATTPASLVDNLVKEEVDTRLKGAKKEEGKGKITSKKLAYRYEIVASTDKGVRAGNEDNYSIMEHLNELMGISQHPPTVFLGLFDGHSGKEAAEYVAAHLPVHIAREDSFGKDIDAAIQSGYSKTDKQFNLTAEKCGLACGTTAITAFLRDEVIVVGNCGDSRAYLCRNGSEVIPLSSAHNPSREDEKLRIKQAGGAVIWYGTWRVNGLLAVSRSIGDRNLKKWVISEPEIMKHHIKPGDEFMILASDGLWDVMTEEQVVAFIKETASAKGRKCVTSSLIDEAVKRNSKDNVSVIVVFFDFGGDDSESSMG